jgi:hypothetical protein
MAEVGSCVQKLGGVELLLEKLVVLDPAMDADRLP